METLCLVPPEFEAKLLEPLRRHFADADVRILVERRRDERRCGTERRSKDTGPPAGRTERRRIRNKDGRRVGERRAALLAVETPESLPRKARPHADALVFCQRIPIPEEQAEDLDTARLVTRIQADGTEEFAALYQRYFDRVYAYFRVALRDAHEAEDAAQQVFIKVFEAIRRYELRKQPFRAWLFTIARNYSVEKLRRSGRVEVTDPATLDQHRELEPAESGDWVLGWISDGDLMLFLERLPLVQRQVLVLRFMLGLSAKEIASILDRTEVDVRGLQHRALAYLRQRLAAVGRDVHGGERAKTRRRFNQAPVLRWRRFVLRAP